MFASLFGFVDGPRYDRRYMSLRPSLRSRFVAATLIVAQVPLGVLALSVATEHQAHADVVITPAAREHFAAGVAFLKDPDGAKYEEAYREFRAAYADSPSYKILGNLGLCALKLERDGEAIDAYEKYLAEGATNIDPAERKQIETDVKTLKTGVVVVKLTANLPTVTIEDSRIATKGDRIVNIYPGIAPGTELRLHPGHHVIVAKTDATMTPASVETDLTPGANQDLKLELKPVENKDVPLPPTVDRPIPTGVYIGLAATGVFVAGFAVVGIMASGKKSDYDKANDGNDPTAAKKLSDDGKKFNLIADVCLGGALVAAGVTSYLYFSRPSIEKPPTTSLRPNISPAYLPGGGGVLMVSGAF